MLVHVLLHRSAAIPNRLARRMRDVRHFPCSVLMPKASHSRALFVPHTSATTQLVRQYVRYTRQKSVAGAAGATGLECAAASLLQQLLQAQNAVNASRTPQILAQNNQSAVAGKPNRQSQKGSGPRANWTREEERCLAELKLEEANKERDGRAASGHHRKPSKMVKSKVCRSL